MLTCNYYFVLLSFYKLSVLFYKVVYVRSPVYLIYNSTDANFFLHTGLVILPFLHNLLNSKRHPNAEWNEMCVLKYNLLHVQKMIQFEVDYHLSQFLFIVYLNKKSLFSPLRNNTCTYGQYLLNYSRWSKHLSRVGIHSLVKFRKKQIYISNIFLILIVIIKIFFNKSHCLDRLILKIRICLL